MCRYTPGVGQLVQKLPPEALRQSLQRQRRAQQVAAETDLVLNSTVDLDLAPAQTRQDEF